MTKARVLAAAAVSVASCLLSLESQGATISACVQQNNGAMRIVANGTVCPNNAYLLEWAQASSLMVEYVQGGMVPSTSVARAYCPAGWKVTGGGGGKADGGVGISQSHPISATDGLVAFGPNAIGWQVAAEDWSDVFAFVVCATVQ